MTYTSQNGVPKRLIGFGFVVLFHIALIYALASGLGSQMVEVLRGPIETKIIQEVKQKKEIPPPPPPKFVPPPPYVPPPQVTIQLPAATSSATAITEVTHQKAAPKPAPPPVIVAARSDPRHPNSRPPYPPTSRRLEEEGTVILNLYVLPNGRVGSGKILRSSGSERLDQAALNEALRNWHFLPATENGRPIASWHPIAVTFRLED